MMKISKLIAILSITTGATAVFAHNYSASSTASTEKVQTAWGIADEASVSHWDALIIAAAIHQDCEILLSEDLQHGQVIEGVRVVNPFLDNHAPDSLTSIPKA